MRHFSKKNDEFIHDKAYSLLKYWMRQHPKTTVLNSCEALSERKWRIHVQAYIFSQWTVKRVLYWMVETKRFELLTPCVQGRCSPSWAMPPWVIFNFKCHLKWRFNPHRSIRSRFRHKVLWLSRLRLPVGRLSAMPPWVILNFNLPPSIDGLFWKFSRTLKIKQCKCLFTP